MIARTILLLLLVAVSMPQSGAQTTSDQRLFDTPEAAVSAFVAAVKANDSDAVIQIFGTKHRELIDAADPTRRHDNWARFTSAAEQFQLLRKEDDGRITLVVGADAWPFPVPLVKVNGGWRFDTDAAVGEIAARSIGENELTTIATLRACSNAQRQYASKPRDGTNVRQFAQRIRSTSGKKDGLYWNADAAQGQEESPLGPLIPDAASHQRGTPYHGYYYKILKRQGSSAPAGAYSYIINGRMIAGYALVAYPAQYGISGIKTFIINHYGVVYEKDLGANTAKTAAAMTEYNPDPTWKAVEQ